MTAKEPIESRLEKLGRAIGSDESLVQNVMGQINSIKIDRKKFAEFEGSSLLRRFIMNRLTKLAAAAVIAVGIVFGVKVLMNDLARPAYALEQTLEACKNKQQAHFTFVQKDELNKAAWVEYDADGNLARVRVDMVIDSNGVPNQVIVWQEGHTQCWNPKRKELRLFDNEQYTAIILHFVRRYDPRRAVEYMQELERKGDVEIGIEQPSDRSKPIAVTVNYKPNTFRVDSAYPPMREVMLVDQATKLVTAVEVWGIGKDFGLKEDEWLLFGVYKYDGYDEPFEDGIFDLEAEVGEDVNIIDMMTLDVGLEFTEPNLTEEQMAVATVRAFFEAIIAKDYNETARLNGVPGEMRAEFIKGLEKMNLNVVEIVSIGEPRPHSKPALGRFLIVPCTIALDINGQRVEKGIEDISVGRPMGHPNRRTVEFDAWSALVVK
jgi:hypothetical protein